MSNGPNALASIIQDRAAAVLSQFVPGVLFLLGLVWSAGLVVAATEEDSRMSGSMADAPTQTTNKCTLLLEGIASQMRRADAGSTVPWWHLISEEERERYRAKARNHIDQVGWEIEMPLEAKVIEIHLGTIGFFMSLALAFALGVACEAFKPMF